MAGDTTPITSLLFAWQSGSHDAYQKLVPLVYDTLRSMAARQVRREQPGQRMHPTELVHEFFLKVEAGNPIAWENRGHFFAIAGKLMRQVLVSHARKRNAAKRGGPLVPFDNADLEDLPMSEQDCAWIVDMDDALNELAEEDKRKSDVVEMRYFGGLTVAEISQRLDLSISTVERDTRMALAWLRLRIRSGGLEHLR
ncbi:MAG: sigma-70 family RNA polymerase sigma factor [Bryobacterales bacterium]|nr:sigma-70 family RNA polymerase sigma factor [Bryobacterales bacterium]